MIFLLATMKKLWNIGAVKLILLLKIFTDCSNSLFIGSPVTSNSNPIQKGISFEEFSKDAPPGSFKLCYWNYKYDCEAVIFLKECESMEHMKSTNLVASSKSKGEEYYKNYEKVSEDAMDRGSNGLPHNPLSIYIEDFESFSRIVEKLSNFSRNEKFRKVVYPKYTRVNLEIRNRFQKSPETDFFFFGPIGKITLIKRVYYNGSKVTKSLFIPEIMLFNHKNIAKSYAMLFDKNHTDMHYAFMTQYIEQILDVKKYKIKDISIRLYLHLKKALSVAVAIEYLNEVHGRVHGHITDKNVLHCKEDEISTYKLIDFKNSFKLGEHERLRSKCKSFRIEYASPEEAIFENDEYFFCRKSEIWSVGALLMVNLGFMFRIDKNTKKLLIYQNRIWRKYEDIKACQNDHDLDYCCLKDFILNIMKYDVDERPNITKCISFIYDRLLLEEKYLEQRYDSAVIEYTETPEEIKDPFASKTLNDSMKSEKEVNPNISNKIGENGKNKEEVVSNASSAPQDIKKSNDCFRIINSLKSAKLALKKGRENTQTFKKSYEDRKSHYPEEKKEMEARAKLINDCFKKICEKSDNKENKLKK